MIDNPIIRPSPATFENIKTREFWTARQRQGHSLHEISYRACFKPQLPEYFIEQYTQPGDLVIDPFLGRGTTSIQAHLMGRRAAGSDVNPLCVMLTSPRFNPPLLSEVESGLNLVLGQSGAIGVVLDAIHSGSQQVGSNGNISLNDLLAFYHPITLAQLIVIKNWFVDRASEGTFDDIDNWIRMVCINRLSGHSSGFFSVRTMPPNQAVSAKSQRQINDRNCQQPEPKEVSKIVIKKSRSLLRSVQRDTLFGQLEAASWNPILETTAADNLFYLKDSSTDLVVTSPPFLNVVDYKKDNWLRCWFVDIDPGDLKISVYSSIEEWKAFIRGAFEEMCRVVREGGRIAFEVGEVRNGKVQLEEIVLQAVEGLPVALEEVLINQQNFTKTSNLWGIANNQAGTNTNRIVLFKRSP